VSERVPYLREKISQLDRSVNFNLVDRRSFRDLEILRYLLASEEASQQNDFLLTLQRYTSLNWQLGEFEDRLSQELDRLDQTIAALALQEINKERVGPSDRGRDRAFDPASHMQKVREAATYPEDSFAGRQVYLDQLATSMFTAQLDWHDTLESYAPSEISLDGFEDERAYHVFEYDFPNLDVNLTDVKMLPLFETDALAAYYCAIDRDTPRSPDVVEVDACGHDPDQHFEWAEVGHIHHLGLERRSGIPKTVLAYHLGVHLIGNLTDRWQLTNLHELAHC